MIRKTVTILLSVGVGAGIGWLVSPFIQLLVLLVFLADPQQEGPLKLLLLAVEPCCFLIGGLGGAIISYKVLTKTIPVGVCKSCGYNLRDLTEPRCPECELPFDFDDELLKKND